MDRLLTGWHRLAHAVPAAAKLTAHLHGRTLEIAATANGRAGCRGAVRWAAAAGSIAVAQMLAGPAVALPTVFFSASTNLGGTLSSQFSGGGCLSSENPAGNADGSGCVDLFAPRGPTVTSSVSASTGFDANPRPHATGAQASGQGRVQYSVSLASLATPPTHVFSVPVHVFGSGAASIDVVGDASANARARLRIAGGLHSGPGPGAAAAVIDVTAVVNSLAGPPLSSSDFVVDQVFWVPVLAGVFGVLLDNSSVSQAVADQFNPGTAAAGAYVDPLFTFDQPAFDAWAASDGFASFDLGQYYRLVADLPEPANVSEPASGWLMCAALAAVLGRWRRRRLS